MPSDIRVTLIFDHYRISPSDGVRIRDVRDECEAFREIEDLLRRDSRYETVHPKTFVIEGMCWEHFRTYWTVKGIRIAEVTPRRMLCERFLAEPPIWLTDQLICTLQLLHREGPSRLINDDWPTTIATWLLPGIGEIASLREWLRVVASAADWPAELNCTPAGDWVVQEFSKWASTTIHSNETVAELRDALRTASSPISFAKEWTTRTALLPLTRPAIDKPLAAVGLPADSPRRLTLAGFLPLVFPLPGSHHQEVSHVFRRALQFARIDRSTQFESVILCLNALWDGVLEEVATWLDFSPRGMTSQVSAHLARLPGFKNNETAQRLILNYSPPKPVTLWNGLDDDFDAWATAYGSYLRSVFFRRDSLQGEGDPATRFSRWLKDNTGVFFNHPARSYRYVAQAVQTALADRRTVIVILVDALAIHVTPQAVSYLSDKLQAHPTDTTYVFAPLPTVSEVCKEAILTGRFPSECNGNLFHGLSNAYQLSDEQIQTASNWHDAERLQVNTQTKLLVYRDNRLDDRLKAASSYSVLTEELPNIFSRMSRLILRWVDDLRLLNDTRPLVLLTADHGFTFGPPPGSETGSHRKLDGSHRCIEVTDRPTDVESQDESLTFIDKDVFHLKTSYLAARGRYFGKGTVSGWALSHGGLLPEEVIVPVVQWFGEEAATVWPNVSCPDGATRDRNNWIIRVVLENRHLLPIPGGNIRASVVGDRSSVSASFPRLESGSKSELLLTIPSSQTADSQTISLDFGLSLRTPVRVFERAWRVDLSRTVQFVERTDEQANFEQMFQ